MPINSGAEILRARRPSDIGNDAYGSTQPDIDPIMMLSGLLGPALLRQVLPKLAGGMMGQMGGQMAGQAPKPFSSADMLAARVRAQAQSQAPIMKAEQLAKPAMGEFPLARPMHANLGGGSNIADNGFLVPKPEPGGLLSDDRFKEFIKMLLAYHRN